MNELGNGAGFLVLSTGEERRPILWECLASIQRHYPGAPIQVISDTPTDFPTALVRGKTGTASRFYKTRALSYSPFGTTVLIDDDAVIHRPFGTAADQLAGKEMAMVPDWSFQTLGQYAAAKEGKGGHVEELTTFAAGREDRPYFNSGVMIFTKSPQVKEFFNDWHWGWLRYQKTDQQALPMALDQSGLEVASLPREMNDGVGKVTAETIRSESKILHFRGDKLQNAQTYAVLGGWGKASPHAPADLLDMLRVQGLCYPETYLLIAAAVGRVEACKMLVFGAGADSMFWKTVNRGGTTTIVESAPEWVTKCRDSGIDTIQVEYKSRRGILVEADQRALPSELAEQRPDVIFVDGPKGFRNEHPGRELPIIWARLMNPKMIVVHDYDRAWERALCSVHLGTPDMVIGRQTAVWFGEKSDWSLREAVIDVL